MITKSKTNPLHRAALQAACLTRVDRTTRLAISMHDHVLVYLDGKEAGVIRADINAFANKFWKGKKVVNPNLRVTFVGHKETTEALISDFT